MPLKIRDAFRAQYFISYFQQCLTNFEEHLSKSDLFVFDSSSIVNDFLNAILFELDQILLPTIALEIHNAKQDFFLKGLSPKDRYQSYYVQDQVFTDKAGQLSNKYPYLFEWLKLLIKSSFDNLILCLKHFTLDRADIEKFLSTSRSKIVSIKSIGKSDRHRGSTVLLIELEGGKLLYKKVDLTPDVLFAKFVERLALSQPFDLKTIEVLPRDGYGWIKYVEHEKCQNLGEVKNFFKRSGVLLAITDCLNYSDGHFDNLIASGSYPILLDGETLFQNYYLDTLKKKNILQTMLIEKNGEENNSKLLTSALQTIPQFQLHTYHPHAIGDGTDDLEIRYQCRTNEKSMNLPYFKDKYYSVNGFMYDCVEGYIFAHEKIFGLKNEILNDKVWWKTISKIKARVVMRPTAAYVYLLRRIQQPDLCGSKPKIKKYLWNKLKHAKFASSEINEILNLDIPYFLHRPGETNLYDGFGKCYRNYFSFSSIDALKYNLANWSIDHRKRNIEILNQCFPQI